jgi:ABC-type antimicrobial peptide transport system permease subunit
MHLYYYAVMGALQALRRNVLRSALTCLGIVIAVAAVIAIVEIGNGATTTMQRSIASMGAAIMWIFPGTVYANGAWLPPGSGVTLTAQDCAAIQRECDAVRSSAPIVGSNGELIHNNKNWQPASIIGSTAAYFDIHDWSDFADGGAFTDEDVTMANRVCLIGQTVARQLFDDGESPVGKEVRLGSVVFTVVGVLSAKGANMFGSDQDDIFVAPWTTIKFRVNGAGGSSGAAGSVPLVALSSTGSTNGVFYPSAGTALYPAPTPTTAVDRPKLVRFPNVDALLVSAKSEADIPDATDQIIQLLRQRHHLRPDAPEDFTVRNLSEIADIISSTGRLMSQLLLCVALISLVVGGVGIMNIMLVSVTERTREIGLRMAVGAKARDILRQFLVEAVMLCLLGGLIGLIVGHLGSMAVASFLHWPIQASVGASVAALSVSAAVGIIFGYYPAWKASRMVPIEAIRFE